MRSPSRRSDSRALWTGIVAAVVVGGAIGATLGVSAVTEAQGGRVVAGTYAQTANAGSCARHVGVIDSTGLPVGMIREQSVSESHPFGFAFSGAAETRPVMEWFQSEIFSTPEASLMRPRMPSAYAAKHPTAMTHIVETVQTFASMRDAISFAGAFATTGAAPQVLTASGRIGMQRTLLPGLRVGTKSFGIEWSLPEASVPTQIQMVLVVVDTVLTIEVIGGTHLQVSDVAPIALSAFHNLGLVCGLSYAR